jgi:hypothetical protein
MKKTIIMLTVVGSLIIGGIALYKPTQLEYTQENSEEKITALPEVVEVDVIEKRIADAKDTAMSDINAKADTLRDDFIANELKKIEAKVLAEIEKELKERRVDVEKQTGLY